MSIAAQARAKLEAAAVAAAAASAEVETARPVKVSRPSAPDLPTTVQEPGRTSPARQRRAYLIASTAGGILAASGVDLTLHGANDDGVPGDKLQGEAATILLQMQEDRRRLKEIQSIERKVEYKRGLLPAYEGWCAGVIAAGKTDRIELLDDLFTTVMAWRIDVGDYVEALTMAEHCFRYDVPMPERFKRGTAAFVVEQIALAAITAYEAGDDKAQAFPAAVLPMLQDLIETYDEDLHDEISAKLQRAIGMAILAGADLENEDDLRARREQTLKCYLRALELNPRVGVKKEVEKLQRQLKPGATPPATETPATETPATEAPATETPATETPATETPATETPATEAPATESAATETPATEAPASEDAGAATEQNPSASEGAD